MKQRNGVLLAIPTRYRGYHFRSRLEARWAVFFDSIGIQWAYEPESFKLQDGSLYLPDFFLTTPSVRFYAEVKPLETDAITLGVNKLIGLLEIVGDSVPIAAMLCGVPGERKIATICSTRNGKNIVFKNSIAEMFDEYENVYAAVCDARSARFEHGQSGRS